MSGSARSSPYVMAARPSAADRSHRAPPGHAGERRHEHDGLVTGADGRGAARRDRPDPCALAEHSAIMEPAGAAARVRALLRDATVEIEPDASHTMPTDHAELVDPDPDVPRPRRQHPAG